MDPVEIDQPAGPATDAAPVGGPALASIAGLRRLLVTSAATAFTDWASALAGPALVLERGRFEPSDLRPWLGSLAILQWDPGAGDYRYRLFGTQWATSLGRDLTGRLLAAWPAKIARAIRDRVDGVVVSGRPAGAHVAVALAIDGQVRRGHTVFEQVVWPLCYGPDTPSAVIALAVPVPAGTGLTAASLLSATGRRSRWFDADGRALPSAGGPATEAVQPH
ncbi:MAG: PAS domain-containing protein [Parvibaculum sp.]